MLVSHNVMLHNITWWCYNVSVNYMLHHITPCYTMLHHVTSYYTMLHHITPCCIILHHITSYYTMLHHITPCYIILHHVITHSYLSTDVTSSRRFMSTRTQAKLRECEIRSRSATNSMICSVSNNPFNTNCKLTISRG